MNYIVPVKEECKSWHWLRRKGVRGPKRVNYFKHPFSETHDKVVTDMVSRLQNSFRYVIILWRKNARISFYRLNLQKFTFQYGEFGGSPNIFTRVIKGQVSITSNYYSLGDKMSVPHRIEFRYIQIFSYKRSTNLFIPQSPNFRFLTCYYIHLVPARICWFQSQLIIRRILVVTNLPLF